MSDADTICDQLHRDVLKLIEVLMPLDPPADSREGRLLLGLVKACEEYEKARWPII